MITALEAAKLSKENSKLTEALDSIDKHIKITTIHGGSRCYLLNEYGEPAEFPLFSESFSEDESFIVNTLNDLGYQLSFVRPCEEYRYVVIEWNTKKEV